MRCKQARELLSRYVNGELAGRARHNVERHLETCPACAHEWQALRRLAGTLEETLSAAPVPEGFDDRVMQAVRRQKRVAPVPTESWRERFVRHRRADAEWLNGQGRVWLSRAGVTAALALVLVSGYVYNIEHFLSQRQTLLLGQTTFAWNAPASLRVIALRDAQSQRPLTDAPVRIAARRANGWSWQPLYTGRTNAQGTVNAFFRLPKELEGPCLLSVETGGGRLHDRLEKPITVERKAKILLSTDKPLYQPGQVVHTRVLALYTGARAAVAGQPVVFEIKDPKGTRVFRKEAQSSRYGIAAADFQLADQVNQGRYRIIATVGADKTEKTVEVKPYVLPKFKVEATTAKSYYAPGETLRGAVKTNYFFGKPVAGGRVTVKLAAFDVAFHDFAVLQGRTDGEGRFAFETVLPRRFAGHPLQGGDALVRLSAEVTDHSGHQEHVVQPLPIAVAPFRIAIVPESGAPVWGLENVFYIVTSYPDGSVARTQGRVQLDTGGSVPFKTDESGIASVAVQVGGSSLRLAIEATDRTGRRARVARGFSQYSDGADVVLLRTNRAIYRVGDTLIGEALTVGRSGTVYLDVSRGGQTVLTRSADNENGRARFALDLSDDLAGTLTLHAYFLAPNGDMVRDTRTVIVQPAHDLKLAIQPSAPTFRPGAEAQLHFALTDPQGQGVPGAIGLNIVDESVFALRETDLALERDYFAMEQALLAPRYQAKFGLPPSFAPDSAVQRRAAVALACLPEAQVTTGPGGPFALNYGLRAESWPEHLARVKAFRDKYLNGLYWTFMLAMLLVPAAIFLRADSVAGAWWLVAGSIFLATTGHARLLSIALGLAGFGLSLIVSSAPFQAWRRRVAQAGCTWDGLEFAALLGFMLLLVFMTLNIMGQRLRTGFSTAANSICTDTGGGYADDTTTGNAQVPPPPPSGAVRMQTSSSTTLSQPPGQPEPPRLRQFFPETLFWQPEIIADERGQAQVSVPMADSITTWRLSALASTLDGRIGSATQGLRVFQEFFINPDLPASLTQNDWVSMPVAVHNYLPAPQRVRVELAQTGWFDLSGPAVQEVMVAAHDVGVVHFPITARRFGRHTVKVTTQSGTLADAVQREVEVVPDGQEQTSTQNGRLRESTAINAAFPVFAVPGTERMVLTLHPGVFSQIVQGLDGMLQAPYGCFEQTSSITYPNILILDYLKRTGKATPEVRLKAEGFINQGYQRILTYETPGGGFDWWGQAPAKTNLTAYGVMELSDMARVANVDEKLIERAKSVLLQRQHPDGSWADEFEMETWSGLNAKLPLTAYVTWALAYAKAAKSDANEHQAITRGLSYLESHLSAQTDAYTLALAANAFATAQPDHATAQRLLSWLDSRKTARGEMVSWSASQRTLTYGLGDSAQVETTALAAQALLRGEKQGDTASRALSYLTHQRAAAGGWGTTQATILALQALSLASDAPQKGSGTVQVQVNDRDAATLTIDADNFDVTQQLDLTPYLERNADGSLRRGASHVALRVQGNVQPLYQLALHHTVPWHRLKAAPGKTVDIAVRYDRATLRQNDTLTAHVTIQSRAAAPLPMLMADIGLAPGFAPDTEALSALVAARRIERFEITPRQLILYLRGLPAHQHLDFKVGLRARFPVRAQTPPSVVYEYYNPQNRAVTRAGRVNVGA